MTRRPTVLSLGPARTGWPREVARWVTSGRLAVDHQPCLSPDELVSRLAGPRPVDVVLVDASLVDDRELAAAARARRSAVIVVAGPRLTDRPDWAPPPDAVVIPPPDEPEALRRLLDEVGPIPAGGSSGSGRPEPPPRRVAPLVVVTGHGGAGTSTVAGALARRWAGITPDPGVCLADLSLRPHLHVHHAVDPRGLAAGGDDWPGAAEPATGAGMVEHTVRVAGGYRLLVGFRHPGRPEAEGATGAAALLDGLRGTFPLTVADVDEDVTGRAETGSADIEARNALTRHAVTSATALVVVARADLLGLHRLCEHLEAILGLGRPPDGIRVVLNGARRHAPAPGSFARDLAALLGEPAERLPVLTLPHRPGLEARVRDGRPAGRRFERRIRPLIETIETVGGAPSAPTTRTGSPAALR